MPLLHRRIAVAAAAVIVLAAGTLAALTGMARATSPPGLIQVDSCSPSSLTVTLPTCTLSGTITHPQDLVGSVTSTSTSPNAVNFTLTVTCYQSGVSPVTVDVDNLGSYVPFTGMTLWQASQSIMTPSNPIPSDCTVSGHAEGSDSGVTFTAVLDYQQAVSQSASASPSPSASPAASPSASPVRLVRGFDGICVRDMGDSAAPRTKVVIWQCNPVAQGQGWTYRGDELRIHGSMCVDAKGDGASGSPVILWPCDGAANETWVHRSNGEYALKARSYKVCLTDPRFATANGTQIVVAACSDARDQQWSLP
jgi:hypothetical protein